MRETNLEQEQARVNREMMDKYEKGELRAVGAAPVKQPRYDETPDVLGAGDATPVHDTAGTRPRKRLNISTLAAEAKTPNVARWEETPAHISEADATPASGQQFSQTPTHQTPSQSSTRRNRWGETPKESVRDGGLTPGWGAETPRDIKVDLHEPKIEDTPGASKRRSRWDMSPSATPGGKPRLQMESSLQRRLPSPLQSAWTVAQ